MFIRGAKISKKSFSHYNHGRKLTFTSSFSSWVDQKFSLPIFTTGNYNFTYSDPLSRNERIEKKVRRHDEVKKLQYLNPHLSVLGG